MIFTNLSFDGRLENPIVITSVPNSTFTNGYYMIENVLTGSNVIFYTFSIHQESEKESSQRLLLPLDLKASLFQDSHKNPLAKLRPVSPMTNGNARVRIKLKQAFSSTDSHITIKPSQLNTFMFEITQKINFNEALYNRLMLKDQLICSASYFLITVFKWVLVFKVATINWNDVPLKAVEYYNMALPVDENTKFSINYFPPRPHYPVLLNSLKLPMSSFLVRAVEGMLLHESERMESNIFPQRGLNKCRNLIRLLEKAPKTALLPKLCLVKVREDPIVVDNLLQVFFKGLQKNTFPNVRFIYTEAFDADGELEGKTGVPLSNIKAVKTIIKAAKMEDNSLMVVVFTGMKALQLSKKHIGFIKYCNETFKELQRVLLIIPMYFDKEAESSKRFHANEIEVEYHDSIEISLAINTKAAAKRLKDFEYIEKCVL